MWEEAAGLDPGAALPARVGVAEVERYAERSGDREVAGHLGSVTQVIDRSSTGGRSPSVPVFACCRQMRGAGRDGAKPWRASPVLF